MKLLSILNNIISESLLENGCDFFYDSTNIPDYDDMISKGDGVVITMTPREYFKRCAQLQKTDVDKQYSLLYRPKVKDIMKSMKRGIKVDLPYIDYIRKQQEGRHRVMAASELGCRDVDVAVIFKNDYEDPYYSYGFFTLNDVYGKWNDVKMDDNKKLYIEYFYGDFKQMSWFLHLFEPFDEIYDLFDNYIDNKPCRIKEIPSQDYNIYNYEISFDKNLSPEIDNFLRQELLNKLTDEFLEEEDFDYRVGDILNKNKTDIRSLLYIFGYFKNMFKEPYQYLKNMIGSIFDYLFCYHNSDFFSYINDDYDMVIDKENKIIKLYSKEKYYMNYEKYNSAKHMLLSNKIKISNHKPYDLDETEIENLSGKLANIYFKTYPYHAI